jgi:subtilisin family serine protease
VTLLTKRAIDWALAANESPPKQTIEPRGNSMFNRKLAVLVTATLLGAGASAPVLGQASGKTLRPASQLAASKVDAGLANAQGRVEVVVRLAGDPVAVAAGQNWKQVGTALNHAQQRATAASLTRRQSAVMQQIAALGGTELARVRIAYNALVVGIDASRIDALASLADVVSVRGVRDYELMLGETVPYVGAAAVQAAGVDGSGVKVAVLDSGIDYTHRNLGGAGTPEAYEAAYGTSTDDSRNTTLDGLFPTAKVVAGYDFVGEAWPDGERTEDPDPIDLEGHGTHVADIIAGRSADGTHQGVAPGADLVAVKVCSAISSSCNGVALLLGVDYALDPNRDGAIDDAVDVINMSLGSAYGQIEDDLSGASANAVRAGVVVVASAGNSADRPYITGSPAATPGVISVAQTQVPSARAFVLDVTGITPSAITNTATVEWAPIGGGLSGQVVRLGQGCPAGSVPGQAGADPYFNGNSPAGRVALIDRGGCSVSLKVDRATKAGATAVIIANNAAGDAPSFSFGGGDLPLVPTIVITLADGNRIKTALGPTGANAAVVASMSSANSVPLSGSMVASSSRGPSYSFSAIKPDIGAPGASISAIAGTGTGVEAFGGTSGAAPMVSGAAALLLQRYPDRTPNEIKAMLMNTAETQVYINPATQPGVLAPITRIGGGEVRVNRAIGAKTIAHDRSSGSASLSYGYEAVATGPITLTRQLEIRNFDSKRRNYSVAAKFRYADDAVSGAVKVSVPATATVNGNASRSIPVQVTIDPTKLPDWNLNGGSRGGNGALLQGVEFDGYVTVSEGGESITVPWHVLPRKAAAVVPSVTNVSLGRGAASVQLANGGAATGGVDVFALTGTSPRIGKSRLPTEGANFSITDLRSVGARLVDLGGGDSGVQFAINTFGERAHPNYPAEFDVYVDANRDGTDDFVLYTAELTGFGATGQNAVNVLNLSTGTTSLFFFNDADLNSANAILTAPLSALGLTANSQFDFSVYAFDNYFTGDLTDAVEGMTITLGTPKYAASTTAVDVASRGTATLGITAPAGGAAASPSQTGLLLMYRNAQPGREAERITVR